MPKQIKTLISVVGPTAIGKTAMAIALAEYFHTEILSADSRQFYREMSIGTAKPSLQELETVRHHFINSHRITHEFNVGDFEKLGINVLNQIFKNHDIAIMAGGSGLYIKAICEGFDNLPKVNPNIRTLLNQELSREGIAYLKEKLKNADPVYYQKVDLQNPQRIIRALEVFEGTGQPFSAYHTHNKASRPFNLIKIGLNLPRETLYERINKRVDMMMDQGLVAEVTSLIPYQHLNALNTVGYAEIFSFLSNEVNLQTAVNMIKQNTRRFAKRQLTWFKRDPEIHWFEPDQHEMVIQLISSMIKTEKKLG
ncbi:MAG: tRNA (adenosine(37)-N6)-dimethylallyltransferase MiaA [Sphingobacteriaceae bacterium]